MHAPYYVFLFASVCIHLYYTVLSRRPCAPTIFANSVRSAKVVCPLLMNCRCSFQDPLVFPVISNLITQVTRVCSSDSSLYLPPIYRPCFFSACIRWSGSATTSSWNHVTQTSSCNPTSRCRSCTRCGVPLGGSGARVAATSKATRGTTRCSARSVKVRLVYVYLLVYP